MPHKKSANTLQFICLSVIAEKIDCWCLNDGVKTDASGKNICKLEEYSNIVEYFHYLPQVFVADVLSILVQQKVLKPMHLQLLLHENTNSLEICGLLNDPPFFAQLADIISVKCKKITYLNLGSCKTIESATLLKLVKGLSNIVELILFFTQTCDTVISALGIHCRKLRELDVCGCSQVTDIGIAALVGDLQENSSNGCLNLHRLDVDSTSVTAIGILHALINLPLLREFHYDHKCETFPFHLRMYTHLASKPIGKFLLTNLSVNIGKSTGEILEFLNDAFPNLAYLKLFFSKSDQTTTLQSLRYTRQDVVGDVLSYHSDTEILRCIGAQLKGLELHHTCKINIDVIGECFPRLETLYIVSPLEFTKSNLMAPESAVQPFMNLKELDIEGVNEHTSEFTTDISAIHLMKLLVNSYDLNEIRFTNCSELTDEILLTVLEVNSFDNLECLSFKSCHKITVNCILNLLEFGNPLRTLHIQNCLSITDEDYQAIEKHVNNKNLEMRILYFPV